ncbi:MAG: GatB/YqeY domain-containing protein [Patescibacteria group bacterium]|nr:GatB/YqeY domain-containing protein [Patescibacteria group bacterium]
MSLVDKLNSALKTAMRERSADKVAALRLILAGLQNLRIAKREDLTDEEVISALQKEVKKRVEAKVIYEKAGRVELAAIEDRELKIIRQWL